MEERKEFSEQKQLDIPSRKKYQSFLGYIGTDKFSGFSGLICGYLYFADSAGMFKIVPKTDHDPMPESVTDRCTKTHEYIFLYSKKDIAGEWIEVDRIQISNQIEDFYYTDNKRDPLEPCYPLWAIGLKAKDKISGFIGTIHGYYFSIFNRVEYQLIPRVDSDGKYSEPQWFVHDRIEIIKQ